MKKKNHINTYFDTLFISGYLLGSKGYFIPNKSDLILRKAISIVEKEYYKPIEFETLLKNVINSIGDPYTEVLNPQETQALKEEVEGEYSGIGIIIEVNEKEQLPQIITVFPDTPAEKAGLLKGDFIKKINNEDISGFSLEEASLKIKGKNGTKVNLTIIRDGKSLDFTIIRAQISIPLVKTSYVEEGNIGYLRIYMFSERLGSEVKNAINDFKDRKVKGIILDLRDNPGGLLTECISVASYFIPSGVLVWVKDRSQKIEPIKVNGSKFDIPLVVLINEGSASASEILASAIKSYKIGTLVGRKTFGKGLIQQMYDLGSGYSLKVTIQEYLAPDKTPINKVGVLPDIEVENDETNPDLDLQLKKAIEVLKKLMIIVISGPSGVGKGTVTREIVKRDPMLKIAVTYTTRKPRNGEINGIDYHFITEKEYFDLLHTGSFAEHSIVHGNYYATPIEEINLGRNGNKDVVFQIDVQGGKKIRSLYPESLLIFLMPPSIDILLERLNIRGTENEEEKRKRIKRAIEEIAERIYYDYVVINDDLNKTVEEILEIIKKEREKRKI